MLDVIIIGKGPAGISTALYTVRAGLKTLVIGKNGSSLLKTDRIENYFGFEQPITGEELLQSGEKQARRLGVKFEELEVVAIEKVEFFEVYTADGQSFSSKALLLATGQQVKRINIDRLQEFEGNGVSYCTTCDGFFYKGLKVGVVGYKDYVIHEAMELDELTKDITIFTNGNPLELSEVNSSHIKKYKINNKVIKGLDGKNGLERIVFEDGQTEDIDGLFIAYETASSLDFARKLGVITKNNAVEVDQNQQTNLEGLFAAGDCTGGFKQISIAVGQGAIAGKNIIDFVRNMK